MNLWPNKKMFVPENNPIDDYLRRTLDSHFDDCEQYLAVDEVTDKEARDALKSVLKECLLFRPSRRPNFTRVLATIKRLRPRGAQDASYFGSLSPVDPWADFALNRPLNERNLERAKEKLRQLPGEGPARPTVSALTAQAGAKRTASQRGDEEEEEEEEDGKLPGEDQLPDDAEDPDDGGEPEERPGPKRMKLF